MALVSSSHRDHRIYEPSLECDYPTRQEQSEFRCRLLIKIHDSYSKALERLNLRARPSMAARFLYGGGFCFGLLDPVSNIIANTLAPYKSEGSTAGIVTQSKLRELERRSLDGLVTFLTRFFPYLADCEAVRYLLLADADVLVAARVIALDRHMNNFGSFDEGVVVGDAFEMALKCAALAARHPEPDGFVSFWVSISVQPRLAVSILSRLRRRSPSSSIYQNITFTDLLDSSFSTLINDAATMDRNQMDSDYLCSAWHLAASRRPRRCSVPYQHTTALKRILLDAIHGFYLQALARLPAGELQSRYHRSLLTAGHCYGPFDPVSNIILNTIWYDAAFPPTHQLEMDIVSTLSLHRIENRSMYGIISFLCTRYHHLDFHQAACCLLHADANLLGADPNLDADLAAALRREEAFLATQDYSHPWDHLVKWSISDGFSDGFPKVDTLDKGPDTNVNEAFKAAAIAGCHPKPDDQVSLLASCKQKLGSALSLLQGCDPLSSTDVQQLARLLCPESPCSEQTLPPFPLEGYLYEHRRISKKVTDVLNACIQMANGEPMYQVHIICGVNSQVSGPIYCPDGGKSAPHKCVRAHVNFFATCRGAQPEAGRAKMSLFFAELSNEDEAGAQSFCCQVPLLPPCAERVRCLYCDYVGTRIVHPIKEDFHGREHEFEKMVCGGDPCDEDFDPAVNRTIYSNLSVIRNSRLVANEIGSLEEDCLYAESFDRPRHAHFDDFALFMDDCDSSGGSLTDDFDASD